MKSLLSLCVLIFSLSAFAQFSQDIVIGSKAKDVGLCDLKSTSGLEGSAYVNVVGRCAWDPAMNGMNLTLTVVSEDPMEDSYEVDLGVYVRAIKKVTASKNSIKVEIIQDTFNAKEEIIQVKKTITVVPQKANGKFTKAFKITSK
jgi:hypothetical protein